MRSMLLFILLDRCFETIDVYIWLLVLYWGLLKIVGFMSRDVVKYLCLPHVVAVSALIRLSGFCACVAMFCMCALYVSFGSTVKPRNCGCVVMGSVVLFIVTSRSGVMSACCLIWI